MDIQDFILSEKMNNEKRLKNNDLYILDILYENRAPRIYTDYSPTLRSERTGLLVIENTKYKF